eukprot:Skav211503  [mRNA]  locus=scaffold2188:922082:926950:+ [translate_table: standard]
MVVSFATGAAPHRAEDSWADVLRADGSLQDLNLKPPSKDNQVVPQMVVSDLPVTIFHRQDDLFKQPKAHVTFYIYSNYFNQANSSEVFMIHKSKSHWSGRG